MAFRAFTVTLGENKISGFAQSPESVRDLAVIDAARETPWTVLGNLMKHHTASFDIRPETLTFEAASNLVGNIRNLGINTLPMYSLVDDNYPGPGDTSLISAEAPKFYLKAPFLSDDAAGHLSTLFVSDKYRPTERHDLSAPEMVGFMFDMMISTQNAWSSSMVYDKRQRKVAVYTATGPKELTMTAFLDAMVPWFVDKVVNCLKCLIHDDDIPDAERAEAYHCLRKLLTPVADNPKGADKVDPKVVTVADVIAGRVPGKTYKTERTQTRECITNIMLKNNLTMTHEKLRGIYPKTHPKTPDTKRYIKKLKELRENADADNDWLKALRETSHKANSAFWQL
jgi:hypothetical protein